MVSLCIRPLTISRQSIEVKTLREGDWSKGLIFFSSINRSKRRVEPFIGNDI